MYHDLQPRPLFVPFQKRLPQDDLSMHEQYVLRSVKAALVAFLIAVIVVGYATNQYEEKLREAKAAASTCQAATNARQAGTDNPTHLRSQIKE